MRVLVIRHGALGDVALSMGPFAAIRAHHPDASITLLTTAPFAGLLARAPWFDAVLVDRKPAPWNVPGLLALRRTLRRFDLVYDLQTSRRSSRYHLLAGRPPWSGIAPECSLPDDDPDRDRRHTIDRQRGQLRRAGITRFPAPALDWLGGPVRASHPVAAREELDRGGATWADPPPPVVALIPGAAPHRPGKRWPVERFAAVARALVADGAHPVVLGAASDRPLGAAIADAAPPTRDLTGRTDLSALARTLATAVLAIGNDTGPMHLAAAFGVPTITLFSGESDPALTAPRGNAETVVLRRDALATLPVEPVLDAARGLLAGRRRLEPDAVSRHLDKAREIDIDRALETDTGDDDRTISNAGRAHAGRPAGQ